MGLQVWLPLNGDLKNYGLDGSLVVTADGVTVDSSGKIGQCYSFNNTRITLQSEQLRNIFKSPSSCFSFATWIYLNSDETDRVIIFGNYSANPFVNWELLANCTQRLAAGGTSNFPDKTDSTVIPKTVWTHLAVTYDGSNTKFYVNGQLKSTVAGANTITSLVGSGTFWLGSDNRTGATRLKGKMNDFRVYDHALSAKEVKEIAKGLVLHYKLDGGGSGNRNLLSNTNFFRYATKTAFASSSNSMAFTDNIQDLAGKTITFSFELYTPGNREAGSGSLGNRFGAHLSCNYTPSGGSATQSYPCADNLVTVVTERGVRVSCSSTIPGNCTINSFGISLQPFARPAQDNDETWIVGQFKLEYGNIATEYSEAPVDRGETQVRVYDCSGYNHNGTAVGAVTMSSDTRRYDLCSNFVTGSHIYMNEKPGACLPKDAITVNGWFKHTVWTNPISCTEGGGWNFETDSGYVQFPLYVSGVGYKIAKSNITATSLANGWHMLTGTFDRTNVKIYIDGVLRTTTPTDSTNEIGYANNYLFIGAEAGGNTTTPANSGYVGNISDIRIYCTALSADDIMELYNTSAAVDKNGNVYAREVIEV